MSATAVTFAARSARISDHGGSARSSSRRREFFGRRWRWLPPAAAARLSVRDPGGDASIVGRVRRGDVLEGRPADLTRRLGLRRRRRREHDNLREPALGDPRGDVRRERSPRPRRHLRALLREAQRATSSTSSDAVHLHPERDVPTARAVAVVARESVAARAREQRGMIEAPDTPRARHGRDEEVGRELPDVAVRYHR